MASVIDFVRGVVFPRTSSISPTANKHEVVSKEAPTEVAIESALSNLAGRPVGNAIGTPVRPGAAPRIDSHAGCHGQALLVRADVAAFPSGEARV